MTKYQVQMANAAQDDLRSIVRYISDTLREPAIALSLYQEIKAEILSLDTMPERCPLWEDDPGHSRELRRLVVKKYVALYQVDHSHHVVRIIRIFYGGRDIAAQLREGIE